MKIISLLITPFLLIKEFVIKKSKSICGNISQNKIHFRNGLIIGFIISVAVTILALLGHFKPFENPVTDILQTITYKKANDVVLLFITDNEYKTGFNSTSPLSRKRLAKIIDVLVKLKAKVIALGIDISDSSQNDHILSGTINCASSLGIPIVIVGTPKETDKMYQPNDNSFVDLRPYPDDNSQYTKERFVLFEDVSPGDQWIDKAMYGGVVFRLDRDGVFRQAEALYMIKDASSKNKTPYLPVPSFPMTVAAAYKGISQDALVDLLSDIHGHNIIIPDERKLYGHDMHIHIGNGGRITPNFIGNYEHFDREIDITRFLEDYGAGKSAGNTIFKDKVVVVGGTYDKKDFYLTPVGWMSGMEVLANITQSIISGNLITHASLWRAFGIEVFLGSIVALIFILTSRLRATVICFVTLVPAVVIASIVSFSTSYYWFDFVPTICGVLIHGWFADKEEGKHKIM